MRHLSKLQFIYIFTAFILIIIYVISISNVLIEIYTKHTDLVIALLGAIITFLLTKGFSKQNEKEVINKAKELINKKTNDEINKLLEEDKMNSFREKKIFIEISLLERNINAAYNSLSEYYDICAKELSFHKNRTQLQNIMNNLDRVTVNSINLSDKFGLKEITKIKPEYLNYEQELYSIKRNLREALNRRDQSSDMILQKREDFNLLSSLTDIFQTMTSDMTKAYKILEELLSQSKGNENFILYLEEINDYIKASIERATKDLPNILKNHKLKLPIIFDVMVNDLKNASNGVSALEEKVNSLKTNNSKNKKISKK